MSQRILLVLVVVLLLAGSVSAQSSAPVAVRVYGQPDFSTNAVGHNANGLSFPIGLALDSSGGLYVADRNNSRILYFTSGDTTADNVYGQHGDLDSYSMNYDGVDGSGLPSADTLSFPVAIALAPDGGLYVTDRENHRVLYYAADGNTTADWVFGQFGSFTSGVSNNDGSGVSGAPSDQNLNRPQFVMVGSDGSLYISDTANNRVLPLEALP